MSVSVLAKLLVSGHQAKDPFQTHMRAHSEMITHTYLHTPIYSEIVFPIRRVYMYIYIYIYAYGFVYKNTDIYYILTHSRSRYTKRKKS